MSALFQKIAEQFNSKLPFVSYCKPNSDKIIALFQKNDDLFLLEEASAGFAFVSFDNEKKYLIPEKYSDVYVEIVNNLDFVFTASKEYITDTTAKDNFEILVKKALQEIENGTFEKVVLSRKELIDLDNFQLELVFNSLVSNYPTAFNYCFYHPKVGFWMGATPEQLAKIENNKIKTVALAGTQLNTDLPNVIWEEKEIKEQQTVTDFIVNTLQTISSEVTKSEPYTFQAGSIVHIKTDIEATINSQLDVPITIDLLHPTPAVCGFPKVIAKEFILKNEGYKREFYAGYLGEWNKDFLTYKEGTGDLFVNLRCMKLGIDSKLKVTQAELFIGCGINSGSDPKKEFLETVNKSQTLKKIL
ncbi:MAG: chorismate-binding protein [Flavobacterium sp.]